MANKFSHFFFLTKVVDIFLIIHVILTQNSYIDLKLFFKKIFSRFRETASLVFWIKQPRMYGRVE